MIESVGAVKQALSAEQYIASEEISTVVFLAEQLGKPSLAEGSAGVGKTELSKAWAKATKRPLALIEGVWLS